MDGPLGREAYFGAAFEILGESGSEGLTINGLCDRLGVTRGSFYHHFDAMPGFVQAFAQHWEDQFAALMAWYNAEPDRCARVALTLNATAALPHEAEAALRAWGTSDPVVKASLDRIDRDGEGLVTDLVSLFVEDPERAALIAHHGVSLAVGMQHRPPPIDRVRYLQVLADWASTYLGIGVDVVVTTRGVEARVVGETEKTSAD